MGTFKEKYSGDMACLQAGLIAFVAYSFVICVSSEKYKPVDVKIPSGASKVFTAEDMKAFDGSNPEKLYMAVKGIVFDVSSGSDFYGKGKAYNALAGKDSSRAVAKMSLKPEDLTHDVTGLSEQELKSLDQVYEGTYLAKYPVVGIMDYLAKKNDIHTHENPLLHDHQKYDL